MFVKKCKWKKGRILLLVAMLLFIGLLGFSCVEGLIAVGWSGGAVSNDTLYVGSKEGRLVAINVNDESRQWAVPLEQTRRQGGLFGCAPAYGGGCGAGSAGVAIYGTPAVTGDRIYIGGYNGRVYSYDTGSLQMDDVYPPQGFLEPIVGGLVVDQSTVYFGSTDGKVYAIDAEDLIWKWEYETEDRIWSTPAISDGILYIGSFDKKLYALNAADGSEKWVYETEGSIVSTPLVSNGIVYFGSFDRYIYAVDANNGKLRWKYIGENWFWAKPVIIDDILYAGCLDGKVYALEADTGEQVKEFDLGDPVSSEPVVYNNTIVVASREGIIYTINTISQTIKQIANIEARVYGPLSINEGIVYIHTQDLTLHRINAATGAVLRSISLEREE